MDIYGALISTLLTTPLNLIVGKLVKNNPKIANALIPIINSILNVIVNVLGAYVVTPAHASVGSVAKSIIVDPFTLSLIQSLLSTGLHSTVKNLWQKLKSV